MTRNITIHDLARALNVTASTISRALNDSPRVSAEMRRRVRLLAEEMRYEHNHLAASLRVGRSQIIGVIVPTANRSFFSNVVRGIEAVAQEYDYRVVICQSNDDPPEEERIINTLLRMRVDGILISIARETQAFAHLEKVIEKNVPLVMFDRVKPLDGAAIAALDDRMGGYEATRHLIEQGYTRIAHFAGPQHINIYRDRMQGYLDALREAGLPFDPLWVRIGALGIEDGRHYARQLMESVKPDAIFSASDYAAIGAVQYLRECGVAIPRQVGIVGFANELFDSLVTPALSSVDQHSEQMGQAAAHSFFSLAGGAPNHSPVLQTIIKPTLIVRDSSKRR